MTLFDKHEKCFGVRLWQGKRKFIQLWYCPSNYEVKPHSHNDQHIELMYLCGKTVFKRITNGVYEKFAPHFYHIFRRFTVSPGQVHWFKVSNMPLIFINFATFIDGKKPTSAAIDFHKA